MIALRQYTDCVQFENMNKMRKHALKQKLSKNKQN